MIPSRGLGKKQTHNTRALKSAEYNPYCDTQRGNCCRSLYREDDDPRKSHNEHETEGQTCPVAPDGNAVEE